jgi:hypothetical protein
VHGRANSPLKNTRNRSLDLSNAGWVAVKVCLRPTAVPLVPFAHLRNANTKEDNEEIRKKHIRDLTTSAS